MSWNAEKEREFQCLLTKFVSLRSERDEFVSQVAALCGNSEEQIIKDAAEIVALLSPMVEVKQELVADPHEALRASYRPGQKWEFAWEACDEWFDLYDKDTAKWEQPSWCSNTTYRLKEDQS